MGGDIGIAASGGVIQPAKFRPETSDIRYDGGVLVCGTREVVGEAATARKTVPRLVRRDFGSEILSCTYGSDKGAAVGEGREECGGVFAVVGNASPRAPNAAVATCREEGYPTRAELCELVADGARVGEGDGLFVVAIG